MSQIQNGLQQFLLQQLVGHRCWVYLQSFYLCSSEVALHVAQNLQPFVKWSG